MVAALGPAMKLDKSTTFNPENMLSSDILISFSTIATQASQPFENFEVARKLLPSLKLRRALFEERRRTFFLIVGRGADGEERGFDEQAFGHARLQAFVDGLNRVPHAKGSICNDPLQHSFRPLDHVRVWFQFVYQTNAIGFGCIDDFAGEDQLECPASSDQTRHSLRASITWHNAKLYFRLAEFCA